MKFFQIPLHLLARHPEADFSAKNPTWIILSCRPRSIFSFLFFASHILTAVFLPYFFNHIADRASQLFSQPLTDAEAFLLNVTADTLPLYKGFIHRLFWRALVTGRPQKKQRHGAVFFICFFYVIAGNPRQIRRNGSAACAELWAIKHGGLDTVME